MGRRLLLIAPIACVLVAVRPTWLHGGLLAGLLVAWLVVEAAPRLTARQQWRANPQLHGESEVTVSTTGIRTRSPGAATTFAWEAFAQVDETDRAFLLSFSPKAWSQVLLLPKRAVTGQADVAALRTLLHRTISGDATPSRPSRGTP